MRKLILIGTLLISFSCSAQVLQKINSYGYEWKKGQFDSSIVPPRDTLVKPLVSDSGATAYKKGILYIWNGYKWVADFSNVLSIRSVTGNGVVGTELKLVNDTSFSSNPNLPYYYGADTTTGRLGYAENKYVIAKTVSELRKLRNCDTSHVYRLVKNNVVMDYKLNYGDVKKADDSVVTLVTTSGQRLGLYIPDNIIDVRWFGAKCDDSTNDAAAIQAAIRYIGNLTDIGGTIRIPGKTRFNPTGIVYPNKKITFIWDNLVLLDTWEIPANVNLKGSGGTIVSAAFASGSSALIYPLWSDTTKAALHMTGDGGYYSDFTLAYPPGIGIYIDGVAGSSVTARKIFDRVSVQNANGSAGKALYIDHSFWLWFDNCSFSAGSGNKYSIILKNSRASAPPGKTDFGFTSLVNFKHTTISFAGIQLINDSANGHQVGNIDIDDMIYESGYNAMFTINSTNDYIQDIKMKDIIISDPNPSYAPLPYINNTGSKTRNIYINSDVTGDGTTSMGTPIINLQVHGSPAYKDYPITKLQSNPTYEQFSNIYGFYDGINANKGWNNVFLNAAFANVNIKNDYTTWPSPPASTLSTGFWAPDGTNTAIKIQPPSGTPNVTFYNNASFACDSSDWVFGGVWVKPLVAGGLPDYPTLYVADSSGAILGYATAVRTKPVTLTNQGWQLITGTFKVPKKLNGNGKLVFFGASRNDAPYEVWQPFIYKIPSFSLGLKDEEVLAWCREQWGAVPNVPAGSRAATDNSPLYIGDSTLWSNTTHKWYQNTLIPLTGADSSALMTFRETERRYIRKAGVNFGISILPFSAPFSAGTYSGNFPFWSLYDASQSTNNKTWDIIISGTHLLGRAIDDGFSTATNWIDVSRTGTTINSITFPSSVIGVTESTSDSSNKLATTALVKRLNATATTNFINSKLGDSTFRTTGPGLPANTIQWKGLIPGSGMNSVTTDSTIKYNWGGTLAQNTTIANNNYNLTFSGTGITALSGGNYNGTLGSTLQINGATINNAVTAASGTVAKVAQVSVGGATFSAANTGVTYTNTATLYVDGPPTAGTNVTITNPYSLYINGGNAGLFHIRGTSGAPTIAVGSVGAGTVSCQNCSDIAGTASFTLTTTGSFPTQATILTITFATPYLRTPNVVFSSNNIDAAFAAAYPYTKNVSTTGFSIAVQSSGTATGGNTSTFTYHVIE